MFGGGHDRDADGPAYPGRVALLSGTGGGSV